MPRIEKELTFDNMITINMALRAFKSAIINSADKGDVDALHVVSLINSINECIDKLRFKPYDDLEKAVEKEVS